MDGLGVVAVVVVLFLLGVVVWLHLCLVGHLFVKSKVIGLGRSRAIQGWAYIYLLMGVLGPE